MNLLMNKRFINEAGDDLIPGKIHTLRKNYEFWKRWDGKEVSIRTWEGKPYRSKQKIICVKRVYVQELRFVNNKPYYPCVVIGSFHASRDDGLSVIAENDGFRAFLEPDLPESLARNTMEDYFAVWFRDYPSGKMACLHFTCFKY
jgi:hypothetical protein